MVLEHLGMGSILEDRRLTTSNYRGPIDLQAGS